MNTYNILADYFNVFKDWLLTGKGEIHQQYDVKYRLIQYLEIKKVSKAEFGRAIGVSSAFVTSMRKSIQPDKVESIALNYPDLNITWLLTGNGEMLRTEDKQEYVPLLPISAQGGSLNDFNPLLGN